MSNRFSIKSLLQEDWKRLLLILVVITLFQPYYYFLVVLARSSVMVKQGIVNDAALAELQWFYYWSTPLYVILIPPAYIFRRRKAAVEAITVILMVLFFSLTVWSIHYIGLNSTSLTVILSAALVATPVLIPGWKSIVALTTTLFVYVAVTTAEYKGIIPMAPVLGGYVPPSFKNPVALFIYSGIVLALTTTAFSLSYWMVSLARRRQEERDRAYRALKIEKDRVDHELQEARRIQAYLLPKTAPDVKGIELSGTCVISLEVGGDYYDYFSPNSTKLALLVADVTGKGVPAAMVMSMVKIAIHSQPALHVNPARILTQINRLLCTTGQKVPVTLFYGVLDLLNGSFCYSNAGQPFPYILPHEGYGSCLPLQLGAFPLGIDIDTEYMEQQTSIKQRDALVMYSDGIVEAKDNMGKLYGFERLEEILSSNRNLPPDALNMAVLDSVKSFSSIWPPHDDATILAVRFTGEAG